MFNRQRYVTRFTIVFPDAIMLMKNALKAGQGIHAAFQMVAQEGPQPVAREFSQVVREVELGNSLTEALTELHRRIGTVDLRIFVLGIFIQHEVGGNLLELFDHVEKTIRDRLAMAREVKILSAQGKMSGVVLMLLPPAVALFLMGANREYFDAMFEDPMGKKILVIAFVQQLIGGLFIKKITQVRVV
jgi:tight adherence protein B